MEFNEEYQKSLDRMEQLIQIFQEMNEETKRLKKEYSLKENDEELLKEISLHEKNFQALLVEFEHLNKKIKSLKNKLS